MLNGVHAKNWLRRRHLSRRITEHGDRQLNAFNSANSATKDPNWQPLFSALPQFDPLTQVSIDDMMATSAVLRGAISPKKKFAAIRRIARARRYSQGLPPRHDFP